jgi:hypothetical protein
MKRSTQITYYLIGICFVLGVGYFVSKESPYKNVEVAVCSQEAKECADGTYVSRTGPDCEFAICTSGDKVATSSEAASPLKTFYDAQMKIGFEYLDNFYLENKLNRYVLPVQWPPEIAVSTSTLSCKKGGSQILPSGKTEWKYINGNNYCLTTQAEGAAGSVYTTYTYKGLVNKKVVSFTFITRVPQCENYDEPQKTECEEEKKLFNIDTMVDKIFRSVVYE